MAQFAYDHGEFSKEVQKFTDGMADKWEEFGGSEEETAILAEKNARLAQQNRELVRLKAALAALKAQLRGTRREVEREFRRQRGRADRHAQGGARVAVGLATRKKASRTHPTTPQNLRVKVRADGTHFLRWSAGENRAGTSYGIETKIEGAGEWVLLDIVTAVTFSHPHQKAGVPRLYRVWARRRDLVSEPSLVAGVFLD